MEYVEKKSNNIKTRCKKYYARQAKLPCDVCDSDAAAPNVLFDNQLHSSDKIKFQNKVKENPLFPTEPSSMVFYNHTKPQPFSDFWLVPEAPLLLGLYMDPK